MEKLSNCPVCNSTNQSSFLSCLDYTVSRETFEIVACDSCNFRFTNPRPSNSEIGKYYDSPEYISHSNTSKGLINKIYQAVREYTLGKKLRLINSFTADGPKSILDIGCGTGEFLSKCQGGGWLTKGVEPDQKARSLAIGNHGLDIIEENGIAELRDGSFQVITMWHVLEHVHELNQRIEELKRLLKNDGTIIIAVPNCSSHDAQYYKTFWAGYDVPRHLYHFVPETMELLLKNHGLKIVKQLPMKFDSFYVSMLSEKYKSGTANLIKAFFRGLLSNIKAGGNAGKYSSVICIIEKQSILIE